MKRSGSTTADKETATEITRFNALKHGILSRYTVLPWEDAEEYRALVSALTDEHSPEGPTEEHLVEELAGILWRKRRLRLAEAASHRRGLEDALAPWRDTVKAALVHLGARGQSEDLIDAIRATTEDTEEVLRDLRDDEAMTYEALALLSSPRNDLYEAALAALRDDTREWWEDTLECELEDDEEPSSADCNSLRRFLGDHVLPWYAARRRELANRPLIREQAYGDSLNARNMEQLARYEVHLDRKLERILTMLIRLKDLREAAVGD